MSCVACSEVKRHDGIKTLISLIKAGQADAVECALTVLVNMSIDEQLFVDMVDLSVIPALIQALSSQLVLPLCLLTVS